jgi:hypothetical protein
VSCAGVLSTLDGGLVVRAFNLSTAPCCWRFRDGLTLEVACLHCLIGSRCGTYAWKAHKEQVLHEGSAEDQCVETGSIGAIDELWDEGQQR